MVSGLDHAARAASSGPAGLDGAGQAVQHDLHAGQLLVAEVLGLVAHGAGLVVGVVEDALGHRVGLADDLGALHHALGLGPHLLHQRVGLPVRLGQELLALTQEPAGLAELVGQAVEGRLRGAPATSSRDTMTDDDSGMDLAVLTIVEHLPDEGLGIGVGRRLLDLQELISHGRTRVPFVELLLQVRSPPPWARRRRRRRRSGPPRAPASRP